MTMSTLLEKKNQGDPYVEKKKGFQLLIKIIP